MTRSEEAGEEAKIDEEVIGKDHYITMFTTYMLVSVKMYNIHCPLPVVVAVAYTGNPLLN